MSISTHQANIRRSKTKIIDLRKKLSKEQETEGKTRKEVLQIKKNIKSTSSPSMLRSKLTKLDRLNKTLETTSKEQSSLNKKINEEEKKLHRFEEQLLHAEQRELKQAINTRISYEKKHLEGQQKLKRELNDFKSAISLHTEELEQSENNLHYDVFISHASEDKEGFVKPLAEKLIESKINVWYDEYKLTWGKSTRKTIDSGLAHCRFGIVVFSKPFFKKGWTNYELNGLVARAISEKSNLILPIWHSVSYEEVKNFSPPLADLTALNTDTMKIEEIAEQLIELLKEDS
jgi:TIR domain